MSKKKYICSDNTVYLISGDIIIIMAGKRIKIMGVLLMTALIVVQGISQRSEMQGGVTERDAAEHIEDLRDGVLIVRIPSYSVQIEFLTQQIAESERQNKYYQKQLEKYEKEAIEMKEACISAFTNDYDFSQVYFIMDTSMYDFLDNDDYSVLFNEENKSPERYQRELIYFCIRGNTARYSQINKAAWIIMDYKMEPLPAGFPYYVGERSAIQSFLSIFSSIFGDDFQRSMSTIAKKFNQNFYREVEF